MRQLFARSLSAVDTPRLIYAGAGLLIAAVLAINALIALHARSTMLDEVKADQHKMSLALAGQADRSFQSVDLALQSVAERLASEGVETGEALDREAGTHRMREFLITRLTGLPQLDAITVINADGKLLNFTRSWPIPDVNVADRDYFKALKDNPALRVFVSVPVQNRGTGTWTLYLARRLSGPDDEFVGLVLGAMTLAYFEEYYRDIGGAPGMAVSLLRRDGKLLARYPPSDKIGTVALADQRDERPYEYTSDVRRERSPVDDKIWIRAVQAASSYPLMSLVSIEEDAALAEWRALMAPMAGGAGAGMVAIAVAATAFARQWRQREDLARARAAQVEADRARATAEAELERRRAQIAAYEAMKQAKDEAEAASRAKSEFLAMVSHELRTPLNAIIGFSELMSQEVMGPLGADAYRDYARDINASGAHLLGVINDILDLTKAEAGMLVLRRSPLDASALVNEVARLMRQRAEAAGLDLQTTAPMDCTVFADERKLRQMLLNLLSNAFKFTKPGGRVELAVAIATGEARFVVRDTGIGIAAKDIERVLKPFVQVDGSLARKHDGTGLGLPLVKAMAELHGGRLVLDSVEGQGTTATIVLPAQATADGRAGVPGLARDRGEVTESAA